MNIDDIKLFLQENEDNEAVQAFINSIADKRVNQAREKWENELPAKVDTEIAARQEREQELQEKRANITAQFEKLVEAEKLSLDWCEPFLPSDMAAIEEEQLEELAAEVIPKVKSFRAALQKERYVGAGVTGVGNLEHRDPSADQFRQAMGLKTGA